MELIAKVSPFARKSEGEVRGMTSKIERKVQVAVSIILSVCISRGRYGSDDLQGSRSW